MVCFSVYGQTADGRVEVIIILSQLLVVAVVEVGAELGNIWQISVKLHKVIPMLLHASKLRTYKIT